MLLKKYAEVLKLAKDQVKEAMAPLRAHEMKKKAELEVAKIDAHIAEKEQLIQEKASAYPICFDSLLDALDDLDLTKRRKEQFEKIIQDLFS